MFNLAGGTLGGTGSGGFSTTGFSGYGNIYENLSYSGNITATGQLNVDAHTLTGSTNKILGLGANTLNNTSAGTFTLSGGKTTLAGGSITSTGGGAIAVNGNQISGYGTLDAPMSYNTAINASGGTLDVKGDMTWTGQAGTLSATLYGSGGNLLLQSKITGGTIAAASGLEVDLDGANLVGTGQSTPLNIGTSNGGSGAIKLTGDSAMTGYIAENISAPIQVNGHTLTLNAASLSLPGDVLAVGNGNLNINGASKVYSGGYVTLGGGNINYTTSSTVDTLRTGVVGYGDIKTQLQANNGSVMASGGTLYIDGGAVLNLQDGTNNQLTLSSSSGSILDIRSALINPAYSNFAFTSSINPNGGTVDLDGATLTSAGQMSIQLGAGTVNVTNDSTFNGKINSLATLGVNSGVTLTNNGTLNNTGAMTNQGTVNIVGGSAVTGSGTYTQTAGQTKVDGSMTQSSVDIKGGSLGGSGTINAPVTLEAGGTLAPGDPQTFTINGNFNDIGGDLIFDIAGIGSGQYDKLIVNGNASINGGTIVLDFINGFIPTAGEYWDIFDATLLTAFDPSSIDVIGLPPGLLTRFVPEFSNGRLVGEGLLVATPEPGTMLLMGVGAAGLALIRRRKKATSAN